MYARDFMQAGGFSKDDARAQAWGGEDVDLYERTLALPAMEVGESPILH